MYGCVDLNISYAETIYYIGCDIFIAWGGLALVVQIAFWSVTGRYLRRTGEFQFLFSVNDRFASVSGVVTNIMVVDTQMIVDFGQ